METIVCQHCDQVIEYVESSKVGIVYGICTDCLDKNNPSPDIQD